MLPTMNLQLTELTRFDTSSGSLTPAGADEPTAVFADMLAVRAAGPEASGESLPPTGNALPLLPDPVAMDAELSADVVLEGEQFLATDPEGLASIAGLELAEREPAPRSIVDVPETVTVALDIEPVPAGENAMSPMDDPSVTGEAGLPWPGLTGKGIEPATPPGPVEPPVRGDLAEIRPTPEVPPAELRNTAPQTAADTPLRPVLAAAAPPVAADPNAALKRTNPLEPSAPVRSTVPDMPAARSAEPRLPLTAEAAPAAPATIRPLLEPSNHNAQTSTQITAQHAAGVADSLAEAVAELRPASDAAPLTRAAAEPQTPRPVQSILQPINTPVQQPDWDRAVSERIVMMANNRLQHAEIRLTPAELGPLRVQVSVDDGAANVSFQAQHAMTREAIEQALPRLRELFAENGLSLGHTSVGHEGASGGDESHASELEASTAEGLDVNVDEPEVEMVRSRVESGLVDTFA